VLFRSVARDQQQVEDLLLAELRDRAPPGGIADPLVVQRLGQQVVDDGLVDGREVIETNTDPLDEDSDDDGLKDGAEVDTWTTDPNDRDTDNGGVSDGDEVDRGTDPLDPSDDVRDPDTDPGDGEIAQFYRGGCGCVGSAGPGTLPAFGLSLLVFLVGRRRR
jgi:uncharacterized protein (TIGR03382 family)